MKKFLTIISYTVLPVWLLLVGLATYLWMTNDNSGDLMRLGLIDGGAEYTDSIYELALPEVYYTGQDNDSLLRLDTCGVVVVGDSFSHGGGVGKTGDYVNYLAHESGRKVVVYTPPLDPAFDNPMQVAFDLLNQGVIDSTNCANLVVQEVERYLVDRHCKFVTTHLSLPRPVAEEQDDDEDSGDKRQDYSPLLRVKDFIFYRFLGANPIYTAQLSRPLFGGKEPNKLYFYNDDVKLGFNVTEGVSQQIVACFEEVIEAAHKQGVNLIILIAADKYDMYQDFIVPENPYPAKTLNEDIAQWMPQIREHLIFSKEVLHPLLEQGVKDVYLYNDTHWSPASSHLISQAIIKRVK